MNKEFIKYEEALDLKELGFDEDVFGYYTNDKDYPFILDVRNQKEKYKEEIQAPLYQQAFRWFRDIHQLDAVTPCYYNDKLDIPYEKRTYQAYIIRKEITSKKVDFKTYEEAELDCLKRLIKIIKEKL